MLKVDEISLNQKTSLLTGNLVHYETYGAPLVTEYSKELDDVVNRIKASLEFNKENGLGFDIPTLQQYVVELSAQLYFTNERLEEVGLLDDLSGISYKDTYNKAYLTKQGSATVADKKFTVDQLRAYADAEAITDRLINFIYEHAAKTIKAKVDAANELLKAISKVLSSEMQMISVDMTGRKGI